MENIYYYDPSDVLHENEHYAVIPVQADVEKEIFILDGMGCAYQNGYGLFNKTTNQIELVRACLPDLLYNAEHLAEVLTDKPYLWVRKEKEEALEADPTVN